MQHRHRLGQLVLFSLMGLPENPLPAFAKMPAELQGKWSSHPGRREPVGGEVDVLTITTADLSVYEISCELRRWTRSGTSLRFDAQCYKGGSPVTPGKVVLQRRASNEIDLIFAGFSCASAKTQCYRRC